MAGGDDEMFMTGSLNVTPKTTEQHLIINQSINRILFQTANVHRNIIMIGSINIGSDKSLVYVINNKRLRSMFCTIEANYRQTQSIARPLCDSRASYFLLVGNNKLSRRALHPTISEITAFFAVSSTPFSFEVLSRGVLQN